MVLRRYFYYNPLPKILKMSRKQRSVQTTKYYAENYGINSDYQPKSKFGQWFQR
jgi:hypothetical protein